MIPYFWQVVSQEKLGNYLYIGTEQGEFGVAELRDGQMRKRHIFKA